MSNNYEQNWHSHILLWSRLCRDYIIFVQDSFGSKKSWKGAGTSQTLLLKLYARVACHCRGMIKFNNNRLSVLTDGIITWPRKPARMNQLFYITVAPFQSGENYGYVETLNKKRLSILQWNYGACAITFWGSAKKELSMNYKLKWFLARWR